MNKEDKNCTFTPQLSSSYLKRNKSDISLYNESKLSFNQFDDFIARQNNFMMCARERIEQKIYETQNNPHHSFKPTINMSSTFLSETNPNRILENKKDIYERLYN